MVKKSEERLERILREDPMRALLHQRMKAAGVSMAALARQIGRGTSYVFDFFHRQTPKYLPEQERAMVAGILDIPESDLRPPARSAPSRVRPRPPANGGRDLPIFGVSPLNEYLVLANPPKIEAWVDRPPILVGITDGYALRVIKRIMEPRFFPGEILYIHPNRAPLENDFVAITMRANRAVLLRRLLEWERPAGRLKVQQLNPLRNKTLRAEDVMSVHLIVGLTIG